MVDPHLTTIVMEGWFGVEALDKWFAEYTSSPVGSILLFLVVFLSRIALDRWDRKRSQKKRKPPRSKANG